MMPTKIALVGVGRVAIGKHAPAIRGIPAFDLAATVDPHAPGLDGLPHFASIHDMVRAGIGVDAVALCTPTAIRRDLAHQALGSGLDVLLEKPPCATVHDVRKVIRHAEETGRALHGLWYIRHSPAVGMATEWLRGRPVTAVFVRWLENVRDWHDGQDHIWQPGGMGVLDPGCNAFALLTAILPGRLVVDAARLYMPSNRAMPIGADITLSGMGDGVFAHMDWRHGRRTEAAPVWQIVVATSAGESLILAGGGAILTINGRRIETPPPSGYRGVYAHFARIIARRERDVDWMPLALAEDALASGERVQVEPFDW